MITSIVCHRSTSRSVADVARLLSAMAVLSYIITIGPALEVVAQTTSPITQSGLLTVVSPPSMSPGGHVQYNIIGGTRAGTNLFHSFGEFNVPTNNIANFLNESGAATTNILGRVTGGNISNIFGTVQTTNFGNANLFLLNPAGFLFGPNAMVNVGGIVAFTSADYLKLTDNAKFNAVPNAAADSLLTASPVAAFGFLGSNPGAITVQGSQFVTEGAGISLVGGNITIQSGIQPARLSASGGQINLVSIASSGEVLASNFQPAPGIIGGSINLGPGTLVDVSGNAGGTVRIRSGSLVIDNATISADTTNASGALVAIDINTIGDLTMSNMNIPALTARTAGSGDSGAIRIASKNFTAEAISTDSSFALIDTHTSGSGQAGKVMINTETLHAQSNSGAYLIDAGTAAQGNGNDVSITGTDVVLEHMFINTGDFRAIFSTPQIFDATGSGGNIAVTAQTFTLKSAVLVSQAFQGQAGDVALSARDITMNGASIIGATGLLGNGAVTITANNMRMLASSQIDAETAFAPGKDVRIQTDTLELSDGSTIRTQTNGPEAAGNIVITATDHVTLSGNPASIRPSGFYSNSLGVADVELDTLGGNAGSITVTTPRLDILGGARIDTTTQTSGRGGNITINVQDLLSISGERTVEISEDFFSLGSSTAGGVFSRTIGDHFCSATCGDGGRISLTTGRLALGTGSVIDSSTTTSGRSGDISIIASDRISLSGTLADNTSVGIFSRTLGTSPGSASGGNIALTAGQSVKISDGATISASSTGPGNAGNISINAGQQLDIIGNSSIKTEAKQASGGNIDIQAVDRVRLVNSTISTSVLGGAGSGGNITIDPNVVALQNSQVIAQAVQGAGGNITITTPSFFADSSSHVSASSQFGRNGTVTIQSPTSNLSESLGTLPSDPSQAHSLVTQRCAALANGQTSSFVVAGREQLPAGPGGWLTSPLAFVALNENLDAGHAVASAPAVMPIAAHDTGTVSLRRLTPAGFLMASFAESGSTGCHS